MTRRLAASPREVWRALTEPTSAARWLGRPPHPLLAHVRELVPERTLEVDWRPEGEEPSVVRFELRRDGETTVLVLDHTRIEATAGMRALAWWTRRLERLQEEAAA